MKIESITLQGFRCFGNTPTTVSLSDGITALVGANGTGKTALLEGLVRVFGITRDQRTVRRTDFYVPPGTLTDDRSERQLFIDIRLTFPELEEDAINSRTPIPSLFHHLQVEEPSGEPFVRLRLDAKWRDDRTVEGEIEQKLCWVMTSSESPSSDEMRNCEPHERGLIQVHYVPASRDPSTQLTYATTAMAGRLLRVIAWSSETQQAVQGASQQIRKAFGKELVIQAFNQTLTQRWGNLHDDLIDAEPEFNIASKQFEEEIRRVCVVFRPTELGDQRELDALSDGQKSLFYFSLAAAVFDIERKLVQQSATNNPNERGTYEEDQETELDQNIEAISTDDQEPSLGTNFYSERLQSPALTIFALEEPENHLAPYFLTRIIQQVRSLVDLQAAQALLTSHSSAVLGRINPSEVRHFRLNPTSRCASINEIKLPHASEEAAKYVREAVSVYPELYFARFVILGEGDSEQVVLPRLASVMGLEVDRSFVAIVPLGGRHVNHFWKLLYDLDIPHATLLDLDKGRQGAGWGRIKYTCKQLLAVGVDPDKLLSFVDESGNEIVISEEELNQLHTRDEQDREMNTWIHHLENFNVFFSEPLDLDMAMLSHFPSVYESIVPTELDFIQFRQRNTVG
jgi:putative ATP-dependent endonuclease of OLD family